MAEKKKKALQGFSRLSLFPITQNDTKGYAVGTKFSLPEVQEMSREPDTAEQKVYSDDGLYLNIKNFNGLTATITVLEADFPMMEKLGFGTYDTDTGVFTADPQGKNKEFGVTFRCLTVSGDYRMYKFFSFTVNELKESGTKTKGDSVNINSYQLVGTFTKRKFDDKFYEMKDSESEADFDWLDEIEDAGATA